MQREKKIKLIITEEYDDDNDRKEDEEEEEEEEGCETLDLRRVACPGGGASRSPPRKAGGSKNTKSKRKETATTRTKIAKTTATTKTKRSPSSPTPRKTAKAAKPKGSSLAAKKTEKKEKDKMEETKTKWWSSIVLPKMREDREKQQELVESQTFYGAAISADNLEDEATISKKAEFYDARNKGWMKNDALLELLLLRQYDAQASDDLLNRHMDVLIELLKEEATTPDSIEVNAFVSARNSNNRIVKFACIFFMIYNEPAYTTRYFLSVPNYRNARRSGGAGQLQMRAEVENVSPQPFMAFVEKLSEDTESKIVSSEKALDMKALKDYVLDLATFYFTYTRHPYVAKPRESPTPRA